MELEEVEACWGTPLFSFLTSQTRLWACAMTHNRHTPTQPSKTQADACTTPTVHTRLLPPSSPHTGMHRFSSTVPLGLTTHNYPTKTQDTGKSSEFDWTQLRILGNELPHVGRLHSGGPYVGMNMHVNLSHRKQAPSKMPKVSGARSEVLALCWAFGGK